LFANLDKHQYHWTQRFEDSLCIFWNYHKYGPGYPYHIYPAFDVIDLLTRIDIPSSKLFQDVDANLERIRQPRLSNLARAPTEIHIAIFECLEYVDALCLAHASRYFWVIGNKRLVQLLDGHVSPWAGDRIICLGEYCFDGLPPSVDFPSDILEVLSWPEPNREWPPTFYEYVQQNFEEIYHASTLDYSELMKSEVVKRQLAACISLDESFGPTNDHPVRNELRVFSFGRRSGTIPNNNSWALRNLDTGEYITLKGIAMNPSRIHRASSCGDQIDLLSVLLYRVTWSTDNDTGSNYPGLHQGPWVGHRFDVLTVDRILKDTRKVWKDISEDVRKELYDIAVADGLLWAETYKRREMIDCSTL